MRISRGNKGTKATGVGKAGSGPQRAQKADAAPETQRSPGEVDVSISPKVDEVQRAQETVKGMPDTRVEVVAAIQSELNSGTYARDSRKIAKRMVDEALRESLRRKQGR